MAGLLILLSSTGGTRPAAARGFRLGSWTGFTEIGVDFQDQSRSTARGKEPLSERAVSEQRLGVRNTATVLNRRFLTINFGLSLGLLQSELTDSERATASGDGRLAGFDLAATFLPLKSYGFNLLSSRTESVTPVEFAGSRRLRTTSYGVAMQTGPKLFPTRLSYRDVELESTSESGKVLRGFDQRTRTFSARAENRWRRHEAQAFLQVREVDDRVAESFSSRTGSASLNHMFELLEPGLATLRSSVRVFDRTGDLDAYSLDLDEELRLRHSANLTSGLRYEARERETFSGFTSGSRRGSAWVRHRLWQSLETDLRIGEASLKSAAGDSSQRDVRLQLDYRKNLPGGGRLQARLVSAHERRDGLRADGEELIRGERLLLRYGVGSRLDLPEVVGGTVIVTDELGSTIFEPEVDYELVFVGEFVEIVPLPGGRLADGQTVLVEYRVRAAPMSEVDSRRTDFRVAVDYGWIEPFFGAQEGRDDLLRGRPSRLLGDRRERFAGVRLRKDGPRLKFLSFNEFRSRDSGLLAFDSVRLADGLSFSPNPRWTVRANLVHVETTFETPLREVGIDDRRLGLRWRPLPTLSLETYVNLRDVRDSLAADQRFDRRGLSARWNVGKLSVIGTAERWQRQRNGARLDGLTGSLRISRRFFPGRVTAKQWAPEAEPWPEDLPGLSPDPGGERARWEQEVPLETNTSELFDLGSDAPVEPPDSPDSRSAPEPPTPVTASDAAAPEAPAVPAPEASGGGEASVAEQAELAVRSWAAAWAARDGERYLSFYAAGFRPAAGASLESWRQLRRRQLERPEWIEIDLGSIAIADLGGGRARASFRQSYRSNLYSDVVDKTLELIREEGQWRILEESTH